MIKKSKWLAVTLAVMMLIGIFGGSVLAMDPPGDAQEVPLYAGQNIEVGSVFVWNDSENLFVLYKLSEGALEDGWCISETHLHVGKSLDEFPLAGRQQNPVPGQFDYSDPHGCVPEYLYEISLDGWLVGDELLVAAHAVVKNTVVLDCWETVWQIGDVEERDPATGLLYNYADEFNWGAPAGPTTMGLTLAQETPPFTNPFIVGTTPTSEFPFNSNAVRGYATDFEVKWDGALNYGGKLTISWSPGNSAFERKVISGDGITETIVTANGSVASGQGWFMDQYLLVEHSVIVSPLADGLQTIRFQHTNGDGTFWDWVRLEEPCVEINIETAWGAGNRFTNQGNWATYFEYTLE
ncbi:MAG: hypothetical protein SCJ97_03305 [Bacillota bacterium]|nr:hypothetical protein [Bacillota bacterium]